MLLSLLLLGGSVCAPPGASAPERPAPAEVPLVLAEVADPAALARALAADPFVRAALDTALVAIRYDSVGALALVGFSHPAAEAADDARIEDVFRSHLASEAAPDAEGWFKVAGGGAPSVRRFEPSEERRPLLLSRRDVAWRLEEPVRSGMRDADVTVQLRIGVDGRVEQAHLVRGSGRVDVDRALLEVARRGRFSPAELDGYPVSVWIEVPFTIRARRR